MYPSVEKLEFTTEVLLMWACAAQPSSSQPPFRSGFVCQVVCIRQFPLASIKSISMHWGLPLFCATGKCDGAGE